MNGRAKTSEPPRRALIARLLHVVACVAYSATAFVPILRSDPDAPGPQIIWTALGDPDTTPYPDPFTALLSAGVLTVAVAAAAAPVNRVCIAMAALVGSLVLSTLLLMVADPPTLLWDGTDGQGRPTGGMAVGRPHLGSLFFGAAGLLLLAGAQWGLFSRRRQRPDGSPPPSTARIGPPAS